MAGAPQPGGYLRDTPRAGAEFEAFSAAYWAHRNAYDAGGSLASYWSAVLGTDHDGRHPLEEAMLLELTELDVSAWTELQAESLALLEDVSRSPACVGLLSNAPEPLARAVRAQPWAALFDAMVFSADVGVTKPDRRIFDAASEIMATRTGQPPAPVLFFDDRAVNVAGADAAGWQGHVWRGHADARTVLAGGGLL